MKKRVYIDVDGVLNALPSSGDVLTAASTGWDDGSWQREHINGYWIMWNLELIDELNAIQSTGVEFRWLTTWCELAPQLLAPVFKLADSDKWTVTQNVSHYDTHQYRMIANTWWKRHLLDKDLTEDPADRVAWLDDDHAYYQTQVPDNILAVAPDSRTGLTRHDIADIRDFLQV